MGDLVRRKERKVHGRRPNPILAAGGKSSGPSAREERAVGPRGQSLASYQFGWGIAEYTSLKSPFRYDRSDYLTACWIQLADRN
jgi:hypothetical protein